MKIEGEVADLVRQAAIMGFARGITWGRASVFVPVVEQRTNVPGDSAIVREVLKSAYRMPETFPALAELNLEGLTGEGIWAEDTAAANAVVRALMAERQEKTGKDRLRADYIDLMREEHGRNCVFLTIAETASEHLGYQPSQEELEEIYQEVVND